MGLCVSSGLNSNTLILSLCWMNSQVGLSLSLSLFSSVFFLCDYLQILIINNIAVSAPAGFPDHPHRGLILDPLFFYVFFINFFLKKMLCVLIKNLSLFIYLFPIFSRV